MIAPPRPWMRSRGRLATAVLPALRAVAQRGRPAKPVCHRRVSATTVPPKRGDAVTHTSPGAGVCVATTQNTGIRRSGDWTAWGHTCLVGCMDTPEAWRPRVRREPPLIARLRLATTRLADADRDRIWAIVAATEAGLSIRPYVRLAAHRCPSLAATQVTPHVWRHTCAMLSVHATGDLRHVSRWWGHVAMPTTAVSLRADPTDTLDAMDAMIPPALRRGRWTVPETWIASWRGA